MHKDNNRRADGFRDYVEDLHNRRPHAFYFSFHSERSDREANVVAQLQRALQKDDKNFLGSFKARIEDPPDCEAVSKSGRTIGIEVTELVDGKAIAAMKAGKRPAWGTWDLPTIERLLRNRITTKDSACNIKGGPYDEYILIICCDESKVVDFGHYAHIHDIHFGPTKLLNRVFFLMSFNPLKDCCDYIELSLRE